MVDDGNLICVPDPFTVAATPRPLDLHLPCECTREATPNSFTWNEQWYVMMFACVSDERMRTSFSTWFRYVWGGARAGVGTGLSSVRL